MFYNLLLASFLDVQTSVAVISPSKAKSVCSLSVCFHKQSESIPSGKHGEKRIQLVKEFTTQSQPTRLVHHIWKQMGMLGVSISYRLSVDTKDRKKRKKRKGKWIESKLNRLRGSSNLQSVTWTLVLKLDIFGVHIVQCSYYMISTQQNNGWGQTQSRGGLK